MNGERLSAPVEQLVSPETIRPVEAVAILDAGAQYVDLIQKACARLGYRADVLPLDTPFADIENKYGGFIVSGGPASSHTDGAPMPDPNLWSTEKGVFGICYGEHAMALAFGGKVESGSIRQDGGTVTRVKTEHRLFSRVKPELRALFTHGDFVTEVPDGFEVIGQHELSDGQAVVSAMAHGNMVAVQFHPEVFDETPLGYDIFRGFLEDMCGLAPNESMLGDMAEHELQKKRQLIAERASDKHVIAFASGGIDSTVATLLASQVIDSEKLHIYYFDNGFMRDEDDNVITMLQLAGINVQAIDATEAFEQATMLLDDELVGPLLNVSDPKIKRKLIGNKFAELKDEIASSLGLDTSEVMLLQGTNAADRIESGFSLAGGKTTEQIKEHHNQVQAIKDMEAAGLLIEPLNDLYKDEIRRLGEALGLPEEVAWRHPFPGPGNAIRILCGNTTEYAMPDMSVQEAIREFIKPHTSQCEAFLLPTKSVGVGGDARSYVLPVALQGQPDWLAFEQLAAKIPGHFRGQINRVVYALGETPLDKLSITDTTLGREERLQLRQADRIVFEEIREHGLIRAISQCPVVLLPLSFDQPGMRSIVLRPFATSNYMTGRAVVPIRDINPIFVWKTAERIRREVPDISQVFIELTNKPPATTEWE